MSISLAYLYMTNINIPYCNTIISGNPQIWGYTPKLGGDTPKFRGDQKDKFQKFEKKIIGKIKEYYFVLFPQ